MSALILIVTENIFIEIIDSNWVSKWTFWFEGVVDDFSVDDIVVVLLIVSQKRPDLIRSWVLKFIGQSS